MRQFASFVFMLFLIAILSACGSSPHDTGIFGPAGDNLNCGGGITATVDKHGHVHCPND